MSRVLPILFNTDMVRATLDDRKTATRRTAKNIPAETHLIEYRGNGMFECYWGGYQPDTGGFVDGSCIIRSPYVPGDILYVRETWCSGYDGEAYFYLADKNTEREQRRLIDYNSRKWHPSIHMPKAAARIWTRVTNVRPQRIQDMTLDDFLKEGIILRPEAFNDPENAYMQARDAFIKLWNSTIPKRQLDIYSWEANPWVQATEFERCEKPEEEDEK